MSQSLFKPHPMTQINGYLHFNGDCREAMTFYRECLGGELSLQTIGEHLPTSSASTGCSITTKARKRKPHANFTQTI
jgi:PhnB protein